MGGSARPASASAAGSVLAQKPQVPPRRRPRPSSMRPARVPRRTVRLAGISPMRRLCARRRSALPPAIDPAPCGPFPALSTPRPWNGCRRRRPSARPSHPGRVRAALGFDGEGKPPPSALRRQSQPVGRINAAPVHPLARGTASRASVALGRSSRACLAPK